MIGRCGNRASGFWFLLSMSPSREFSAGVQWEIRFPLSSRSIEGNFGVPIAGHVDLELGEIAARRLRLFDRRAGVHVHSGHAHIQIEFDLTHVDKLPVAIAKFDEQLVVALVKPAFTLNEIHRQAVDGSG